MSEEATAEEVYDTDPDHVGGHVPGEDGHRHGVRGDDDPPGARPVEPPVEAGPQKQRQAGLEDPERRDARGGWEHVADVFALHCDHRTWVGTKAGQEDECGETAKCDGPMHPTR